MANFKYKKVPLGWITKDERKMIRVNRLSNHTLLKFVKGKGKFWNAFRRHFSPAYRAAYGIAQRRRLT